MASILEDGAPFSTCLDTPSQFGPRSSKIIVLAILEDRPLETTKVDAELNAFGEELNGVLTMDGDVLEEGEIVDALIDP